MSVQRTLSSQGRSRSLFQLNKAQEPKQFNVDQSVQPSLRKTVKRIQNIQTDRLIQMMKTNHENLCTCFDIYELLYQNNVPQRCVVHNNFVTLYCENEHKLLCVNCIYGNMTHKNHRVIPIRNSFEKIIKDNIQMKEKLLRSIENLKNIQKVVNENIKYGDEGIQEILQTLDDQFQRIKNIIHQKYSSIKNLITESYSTTKLKNNKIVKEISWLKEFYIQKQSSLLNDRQQSSQLFNHMLLNTLLQSDTLKVEMFKQVSVQQIRRDMLADIVKLRQQIEPKKSKEKKKIF